MNCSICADKNRKKIDSALVSEGATVRAIARQFGVGKDALLRHVRNGHVAAKIAKAQAAQDIVEADNLLTHIQNRRKRFNELAKEAKEAKDPHLELKVYQVEGKFTEMEARAIGAFTDKLKVSGDGKPLAVNTVPVTSESLKKIGDILAKQGDP